jgi:vacuolar-type H+-ATPase subunit I/STV1
MERLNIAFLSEDRERVIENLQDQGIVEIKEMEAKKDFLSSVDIDIDHLSSLFMRSEKIRKDFSDEIKKQGFFETLLGNRYEKPVSIRKDEMEDVLRDAEKVVKHAEKNIEKLGKESEENRKLVLNIKSEIEVLEHLKGFDFDLGILSSLRKTFVVVGNVKAGVLPVLKTELANFRVYLCSEGIEKDKNIVLLLGLKTEEADVRKLLIKHDFGFFELGGMRGKPS